MGQSKAMKQIRTMLVITLTVVLSFSMMPLANVNAASKKVKLNKTKATVYVGKTVTLKVKNTKKKVQWSTSNKKVAVVTKKGKVKGKKAGKATITAKVGKKKYKCKITVKKKAVTEQTAKQTTKQQELTTAKRDKPAAKPAETTEIKKGCVENEND